MKPINFTLKGGVTHFHYKFFELREFVRLGKTYGDVGVILTKRNGNILTYRGFGTIDSPFTYIATISFVHNPLFGEMPTDEQRLIPSQPFFTEENTKFVMLDFSKASTNESVLIGKNKSLITSNRNI